MIDQIGSTPADLLSLIVGSYAPQLKAFANGIDERPVVADKPDAKSYGEQQTFNQDVTDEAFILATLRGMADRLMAKAREDKKSIRTVTLRLRYNDFDENTSKPSVLTNPLTSKTTFIPCSQECSNEHGNGE
jgi:nucleotidyltransferase/DNA polymerase involved in DNA repair